MHLPWLVCLLLSAGCLLGKNIYADREPSTAFFQFDSDSNNSNDNGDGEGDKSVTMPRQVVHHGFRRDAYKDVSYHYRAERIDKSKEKERRRKGNKGKEVKFRSTVIEIPASDAQQQQQQQQQTEVIELEVQPVRKAPWDPNAQPGRSILRKTVLAKAASGGGGPRKKVTIQMVPTVRYYNPSDSVTALYYLPIEKAFGDDDQSCWVRACGRWGLQSTASLRTSRRHLFYQ